MKKDPRISIAHMVDAARRTETVTMEGEGPFRADFKGQDSIVRNFEIMGEAAKRVSQFFREAHPGVPWADIAAFRNVLIHQYDRINLDRIWGYAVNLVPSLRSSLEKFMEEWEGLE